MDRLTIRMPDGSVCKPYLSNELTGDGLEKARAKNTKWYMDVVERLAAYEDIGTAEEFEILKEKVEPKRPVNQDADVSTFDCPSCVKKIIYLDDKERHKHCLNCGQKLDWRY